MLIYVKIIKKKKKKFFIGRTDGRTHVQLKTIVRNLTKSKEQEAYLDVFLMFLDNLFSVIFIID